MHASELSQLAIQPAESDADLEAMIHVRGLVTPEAHPTVEILRFNLESNPDLVYLVARLGGEPVACGGVQRLPDGAAEVKRMWVHDDWRGAGLGARMLRRLEDDAREAGYDVVRLDTNSALTEAIALYERAGYHHIERYNDNPYARAWFEKGLRS